VVEKELPEWSAYTDEQWDHSGKPGNCGMQPRVRHLLRRLNLDPRRVPASNLVFVRTPRERNLRGIFDGLAEQCWPFHQTVIEKLGVCVVLVFGKRAGLWVRNKLDAHAPVEEFIENNNRRWRSQSFMNTHGIAVMVATHPSIADWTNPKTDPSPLMGRLLESV
jgi:uracil-DNA glycosylase